MTVTHYRGVEIRSVDSVQLGYRLGEGIRSRPGKGRKIKGYEFDLEGAPYFRETIKAAKEKIDDYLGDTSQQAGSRGRCRTSKGRFAKCSTRNRAGVAGSSIPWAGIDSNERQWFHVKNLLGYVYLHGVEGVSPPVDPSVRPAKPVSVAKADEYVEKGRALLESFDAQRAPAGRGRSWLSHNKEELRRLLQNAIAVRRGAPAHMTAEDYRKLDAYYRRR